MKKDKSPAYQWYPKDALSSIRLMALSLAEEGAYRRALDYCWLHEQIPADPKALATIIGKGCTVKVAATIAKMFEPHGEYLRHERLDAERTKQAENRQKKSENGKKGNQKRWSGGAGGNGHQSHSDNLANENESPSDNLGIAKNRFSSPSSIPIAIDISTNVETSSTASDVDVYKKQHEPFAEWLLNMGDSGAQAERESIFMQVREAVTPPLLKQFNAHLFTEKKLHKTKHDYIKHLRSWMRFKPMLEPNQNRNNNNQPATQTAPKTKWIK